MRKDSRHGGGCAVLSRVSRAPVRGEECSLRRLGSPSVAFCVFASLSLFVACASGHNTPPSTPDGNNLVEDDSFMSSSDDEASLQSSYNGEEEIFSLAFAKREAGQPSFEDDDQNISSRRSGFLDGDTQYRMGTAQPEQTTTLQSTLPAFPSPAAPAQSERAAISSGSEPQLVPASGLSETNISPSAVGDLFEPSRKSSLAGGAAALSTAPPAAQASSAASRPTGRSSRGVSRSEGVAPPRSTDLLPRAGSATRSPAASIRKEPPFQVSGFTESETLDDYYTIVGRAAMGVVRTASLRGIEAPAAQPLAARIAATRPIPLRKGESGGTDVVMTETAPDPAAEADPLEAAASDAPQESTEERKSLHNSATRKAVTLRPRTPTWSSTIPRGEASVSHADPKTSRTFRRDGRMRQLQRKLTAAVIASLVMAALLLIIKSFNGEEQDRVAAASELSTQALQAPNAASPEQIIWQSSVFLSAFVAFTVAITLTTRALEKVALISSAHVVVALSSTVMVTAVAAVLLDALRARLPDSASPQPEPHENKLFLSGEDVEPNPADGERRPSLDAWKQWNGWELEKEWDQWNGWERVNKKPHQQ